MLLLFHNIYEKIIFRQLIVPEHHFSVIIFGEYCGQVVVFNDYPMHPHDIIVEYRLLFNE